MSYHILLQSLENQFAERPFDSIGSDEIHKFLEGLTQNLSGSTRRKGIGCFWAEAASGAIAVFRHAEVLSRAAILFRADSRLRPRENDGQECADYYETLSS